MIYQGPEGYLLGHMLEGRLYIHAGLLGAKIRSTFLRQREILETIEVILAERGLTDLYTAVRTPKQAKYAEWLGFEFNGESFLDHQGNITDVEIMHKVIV